MNKSFYFITCLLCAPNILAMRHGGPLVKAVSNASKTVKPERNFLKLNMPISKLFEEGGIKAVERQLVDLQIRATEEVINHVSEEEGMALENAYSDENKELLFLLLKNGVDPSLLSLGNTVSSEGKDSVLSKAERKKEYLSLVDEACKVNKVQNCLKRAVGTSNEELSDIITDLKACDEFGKDVEKTLALLKAEKLRELKQIETIQAGYEKTKWHSVYYKEGNEAKEMYRCVIC